MVVDLEVKSVREEECRGGDAWEGEGIGGWWCYTTGKRQGGLRRWWFNGSGEGSENGKTEICRVVWELGFSKCKPPQIEKDRDEEEIITGSSDLCRHRRWFLWRRLDKNNGCWQVVVVAVFFSVKKSGGRRWFQM